MGFVPWITLAWSSLVTSFLGGPYWEAAWKFFRARIKAQPMGTDVMASEFHHLQPKWVRAGSQAHISVLNWFWKSLRNTRNLARPVDA